jgi:D-3-phosphoglycerate dehydrogenase / 2-oxoglutarate reductase
MKKTSKKMKVLLLENIHPNTVKFFKEKGYEVKTFDKALGEEDLIKEIRGVSILGIRSKTKITEKVLENADSLLAVGAFCIGTDQINMEACDNKGVAVFNAPYANTRSVAELVLGEMLMLLRKVFDKSSCLHDGVWDKDATGSFEMRGKSVGIIGYGNIGSQLSFLAESMGMKVYFFDIKEKPALGNAVKCSSMDELLKKSDVVTLHVESRPENKNLISEKQFKLMRPGSYLLNASRGNVVNLEALAHSLKSGHLVGAAVDVFPEEPKSNAEKLVCALQKLPNVILTPHIGGSTKEAQENIANYASARLFEYVNTGNTDMSNNLPNINLAVVPNTHRIIHIHKNVPGILGQMNNILAKHKINIVGQYLKTNQMLGYAITDIEGKYNEKIIDDLYSIPNTIKVITLY